MKAIIQRVGNASVSVDGKIIGKINQGFLVLLAIHENDPEEIIEKMAEKIIKLRIFSDKNEKMNLSILDIKGEILLISQFTLYGDIKKGNRPSFLESARPEKAEKFYNRLVEKLKEKTKVEIGKFGANMEIKQTNNGPVTIIIEL